MPTPPNTHRQLDERFALGGVLNDITGQEFGSLTVLRRALSKDKGRRAKWLCRCNCGKEVVVLGSALRSGNTRSCGCGRIRQSKVNATFQPRDDSGLFLACDFDMSGPVPRRVGPWSRLPKTPLFSLQEVRQMAAHDAEVPIDDSNPTFRAAAIMVAGVSVGRHAVRISEFLGYPRQEVVRAIMRLRSAGRWDANCIADWGDGFEGRVQFILDVMTITKKVRCRHGRYWPV